VLTNFLVSCLGLFIVIIMRGKWKHILWEIPGIRKKPIKLLGTKSAQGRYLNLGAIIHSIYFIYANVARRGDEMIVRMNEL
jgi:hypothetical protein